MKNITFSADADLIEKARQVAQSEHKTLNVAFREWLLDYTSRRSDLAAHDALMKRLSHIRAGRRFTRDEMNER